MTTPSRDSAEKMAAELRRLLVGAVLTHHPMAPHTSFNVGGPADLWLEPTSLKDLCTAVSYLHKQSCPVTVLGGGTNCLISDRGIRGAVIGTTRGLKPPLQATGAAVEAGAGMSMPLLAQQVARLGLAGYEWACGIPGSVGGSVVMNAGAHGGDTAGCLVAVRLLNPDGEEGWAPADNLEFQYRHSRLVHGSQIAVGARFQFYPDDPIAIAGRLHEYRERRRATQPETSQCAGSVFRNPPGGSAGRLLETLGAKGMRTGGAEVSPRHANFIVNLGDARASDVRSLIMRLQQMAAERAGVSLQPEVLMVGDWDLDPEV